VLPPNCLCLFGYFVDVERAMIYNRKWVKLLQVNPIVLRTLYWLNVVVVVAVSFVAAVAVADILKQPVLFASVLLALPVGASPHIVPALRRMHEQRLLQNLFNLFRIYKLELN
jgi:hypothetical protein